MNETFRNVVLGLLLVAGVFFVAVARRSERDARKLAPPIEPDPDLPKLGTRFLHLDRECVVIDNNYCGADGWQPGVHAHYLDDEGHFRSLYLTPNQWTGVLRERGNGSL